MVKNYIVVIVSLVIEFSIYSGSSLGTKNPDGSTTFSLKDAENNFIRKLRFFLKITDGQIHHLKLDHLYKKNIKTDIICCDKLFYECENGIIDERWSNDEGIFIDYSGDIKNEIEYFLKLTDKNKDCYNSKNVLDYIKDKGGANLILQIIWRPIFKTNCPYNLIKKVIVEPQRCEASEKGDVYTSCNIEEFLGYIYEYKDGNRDTCVPKLVVHVPVDLVEDFKKAIGQLKDDMVVELKIDKKLEEERKKKEEEERKKKEEEERKKKEEEEKKKKEEEERKKKEEKEKKQNVNKVTKVIPFNGAKNEKINKHVTQKQPQKQYEENKIPPKFIELNHKKNESKKENDIKFLDKKRKSKIKDNKNGIVKNKDKKNHDKETSSKKQSCCDNCCKCCRTRQ